MQILKLTDWANPADEIINRAAEVLKSSGIMVYPADTAGYSLGANALDEEAVRKVFEIKNRSFDLPMNIVVSDGQMAARFCYWTDQAQKLADRFLPGALTLVLKKKSDIPDLLTAGLDSVGIRIPDSPVALEVSRRSQLPFTITTANISGQAVSAFTLEEIQAMFQGQMIEPNIIIDAGKLPNIPPSTVLDLSISPPKILRQGPILAEDLQYIENGSK
ncbi:threonylcarbamoyl-AMP synthase [Patescibacteria group bacterium]|nr:threonylcarbamoyl-AMP synthase [Patescibacteria group bacterium]